MLRKARTRYIKIDDERRDSFHAGTQTRDRRIEVRIDPDLHARIRHAALQRGQTVSAFLRIAGAEAADRVQPASAVLIDGSRLYHSARALYEGYSLDYYALIHLIKDLSKPGEPGYPAALWTMWTSASAQNEGQSRFLEFAENDLRLEIRRVTPADSYLIDRTEIDRFSDKRLANLSTRFDVQIAFAMGRLPEQCRPLVVVTDSFALYDSLRRAARICPGVYLVYFGADLDKRWKSILRNESFVKFIDLDNHANRLFGISRSPTEKRDEEGRMIY